MAQAKKKMTLQEWGDELQQYKAALTNAQKRASAASSSAASKPATKEELSGIVSDLMSRYKKSVFEPSRSGKTIKMASAASSSAASKPATKEELGGIKSALTSRYKKSVFEPSTAGKAISGAALGTLAGAAAASAGEKQAKQPSTVSYSDMQRDLGVTTSDQSDSGEDAARSVDDIRAEQDEYYRQRDKAAEDLIWAAELSYPLRALPTGKYNASNVDELVYLLETMPESNAGGSLYIGNIADPERRKQIEQSIEAYKVARTKAADLDRELLYARTGTATDEDKEDIMARPDFEAISSEEVKSKETKPLLGFLYNAEDTVYNFLTKWEQHQEESKMPPEQAEAYRESWGAVAPEGWKEDRLDHYNENDIQVIRYLYNSGQFAEALDYMLKAEDVANLNYTRYMSQKWYNQGRSDPIKSWFKNRGDTAIKAAISAAQLFGAKNGREADVFGPLYEANARSSARETGIQDTVASWAEESDAGKWFDKNLSQTLGGAKSGDVAKFVYEAFNSTADNFIRDVPSIITGQKVWQTVSLLIMSSSAASDTLYNAMLTGGYNAEDAVMEALVNATVEYATEMYGGEFAFEGVQGKNMLTRAGKLGGSEMLEEIMGGYAKSVYDQWANNPHSDHNQRTLAIMEEQGVNWNEAEKLANWQELKEIAEEGASAFLSMLPASASHEIKGALTRHTVNRTINRTQDAMRQNEALNQQINEKKDEVAELQKQAEAAPEGEEKAALRQKAEEGQAELTRMTEEFTKRGKEITKGVKKLTGAKIDFSTPIEAEKSQQSDVKTGDLGEGKTIQGIDKDGNIMASDGGTVKAEDVDWESMPRTKELYDAAMDLKNDYGVAPGITWAAYESGQDVEDFRHAVNTIATGAAANTELSDILAKNEYAKTVDAGMAGNIYDAAKAWAKEDVKRRVEKAQSLRMLTAGNTSVTMTPAAQKMLDAQPEGSRMRDSVRAISLLAQGTGVRVQFFVSEANEEGEYSAERGSVNGDATMIRIDMNAGLDKTGDSMMQSALMQVAGHELTHVIATRNPEGYGQLIKFVSDALTEKGESLYDYANDIRARYKKQNVDLSQSVALEEAVANASERVLKDSQFAQNVAKKNPGLARQIVDWLKDFARRIADIFKADEYLSVKSAARAMESRLNEYAKIWDQALSGVTAEAKNEPAQNAQEMRQTEERTEAQETRQTEERAETPQAKELPPAQFTAKGSGTIVYTSDNRQIDAHWALIDSDKLIASNLYTNMFRNPAYPEELQPRDRTRALSRDQVEGIAHDLNPARLMDSAEASAGAPIVGEDGVVESGNGRTIAIQLALSEKGENAQRYTEALKERAKLYGLNPGDVTATSVLVRVRDTEMSMAERAEFAKEANVSTTANYAASETAASDAPKISTRTLYEYHPDGTLYSNMDFYMDFMHDAVPRTEQNNMINRDGEPTPNLVARAENALMQRAYGDASLIEYTSEKTEHEAKNPVKAMMSVAAKAAQVQNDIAEGKLHDIDFSGDMAQAIHEYIGLKNRGDKIEDWLPQTSLFEASDAVKAIVQIMDEHKGSAKKLTAIFDEMLDQVIELGDPRQMSLLDEKTPDKTEIIQRAKERAEERRYALRDGIEFAEDKYYARLIDRVREMESGGYIKVGSIQMGSVLHKIGLPDAGLYFDVSKIQKQLAGHDDHLDENVLKKIPDILRNPVVISEARQPNTVNVFGEVKAGDSPVMIGIMATRDRAGRNVINKVRTVHARRDTANLITAASVLYLSEDKKRTREWFQARGNVVPLGGTRFGVIRSITFQDDSVNPSDEFSRKSLRDQDASYLAAVKKGDTKTAQRMLDEAVERIFADSKVRGEDGKLLKVYHGSEEDFTVFDRTKGRANMDIQGLFFSPYREEAEDYGSNVRAFYLNLENPAPYDVAYKAFRKYQGQNDAGVKAREELESMGYDGVTGEDGMEYIAFDASQIKSVAPVTYDDSGKVIPLSERFNPQNNDIRYALRTEREMTDREVLGEALNEIAVNQADREYLAKYQRAYRAAAENRANAASQEKIVERTAQARDGETDQARIDRGNENRKAQNRAKIYADKARRAEAELEEMEKDSRFAALARKERDRAEAAVRQSYTGEQVETLRKGYEAQLRRRAETLQQYRESRRETADRERFVKRIRSDAKTMGEWLAVNSDKKHVPEKLKEPLGALLEKLNLYSGQANRGEGFTMGDSRLSELLERVRLSVAATEEMGGENYEGDLYLPIGFSERIEEAEKAIKALEKYGSDPITQMDAAALKGFAETMTALRKAITQANETFANARYQEVSQAAKTLEKDMTAMREVSKRADNGVTRHLTEKLVTPVYFFDRLGEAGKSMFESLRKGYSKFAMRMGEIEDFSRATWTNKQAEEWHRHVNEFKFQVEGGETETLRLTDAQIMTLYMYTLRDQAMAHIDHGGGIKAATVRVGGQNIVQQARALKLSRSDIQTIVNTLSDEQIRVCKAVGAFMEKMSAWGNEVSMARFGFKAFGEKNYFPIQTSDTERSVKPESGERGSDLYKLLNMGFTKKTNQNASNSLLIDDFFSVFANHASDMAKYSGMALPVLDTLRWINYREAGGTNSREAMRHAYGNSAENYLTTFLSDLSSATRSQERMGTGFWNALIRNSKIASVAGNASVALKQGISITRAGIVMPEVFLPHNWIREREFIGYKRKKAEMLAHSGIAKWKDMSYYDMDTGRPLEQRIARGEGIGDKFVELSGKGAELADSLTLVHMWEIAKKRIQRTQKGLEVGSQAYWDAVTELFEDAVYRTQVVDGIMNRSELMRSKSTMDKLGTAFMAEPILTYNTFLSAVNQMHTERRKGQGISKHSAGMLAKAFLAYALNGLGESLVSALMSAGRDDDDYTTFAQKFMAAWLGEGDSPWERITSSTLVDGLNPLGWIPLAQKLINGVSGESNTMDTVGLGYLMKAWKVAKKWIDYENAPEDQKGEAPSVANTIFTVSRAISYMTGLPIYNIGRDIKAVWNSTIGETDPQWKIQVYEPKDSEGYGMMYDAILQGDQAETERLEAALKRHKAWDKIDDKGNVTEGGKAQEKFRAMVKADYLGGSLDYETAEKILNEHCGAEATGEKSAYHLLHKWGYEKETGETYSKDTPLKLALKAGKDEQVAEARRILADQYGMKEKDIQSKVQSAIGTLYKDGEITEAQARALYGQYTDKTELQMDQTIAKADYQAENPDAETGDFQYYQSLYPLIDKGADIQAEVKKSYASSSQEQITGAVRSYIQDQYKAGAAGYSRAAVEKKLVDYGICEGAEAAWWKAEEWDYKNAHEQDASAPDWHRHMELDSYIDKGQAIPQSVKNRYKYDDSDTLADYSEGRLRTLYKEGRITRAQLESGYNQYGNFKDKNAAYWQAEEDEYTLNHPGEKYQKYGQLISLMDKGSSIASEISRLKSHGVENDTISTQLTSHYKPLWKDGNANTRAAIQKKMCDAWKAMGYTNEQIQTKLNNLQKNWAK